MGRTTPKETGCRRVLFLQGTPIAVRTSHRRFHGSWREESISLGTIGPMEMAVVVDLRQIFPFRAWMFHFGIRRFWPPHTRAIPSASSRAYPSHTSCPKQPGSTNPKRGRMLTNNQGPSVSSVLTGSVGMPYASSETWRRVHCSGGTHLFIRLETISFEQFWIVG